MGLVYFPIVIGVGVGVWVVGLLFGLTGLTGLLGLTGSKTVLFEAQEADRFLPKKKKKKRIKSIV